MLFNQLNSNKMSKSSFTVARQIMTAIQQAKGIKPEIDPAWQGRIAAHVDTVGTEEYTEEIIIECANPTEYLEAYSGHAEIEAMGRLLVEYANTLINQ